MPLSLVLLAAGAMAFSGIPGLLFHWRSRIGQWIAMVFAVGAAGAGLMGAFGGIFQAEASLRVPWPLPGAELNVRLDALSGFFLVPIFLIGGLGSIYSLGYWSQQDRPRTGRQVRFFYGVLVAGMAVLVVAKNGILFLFGWEAMALASFFLITAESHDPEVRKAGWLYLMLTHVGTLTLFAVFALLRKATGSFLLRPLGVEEAGLGTLMLLFLLMLIGFGMKAGLMPLHVWLPSAHASAPSHVSALMSGVVIKMGIYGLVRFLGMMPQPPVSWGAILLLLGTISGVVGVLFAIGQHDLKRLLAYHSVENVGIIVMGLGVAMLGRSLGRPDWVILGLAGCLLHVWNHGLFKALLFLGAGSVIHAVHTREIDRMGGLAKSMPRTALLFLIGAVAICGLPPLNGFVSELLVYMGLFRTLGIGAGPSWVQAAPAAPALALIGALAVACFVKVFGAVFLGSARSHDAEGARESSWPMVGAMGVLAVCCVAIGVAPVLVGPVLDRAAAAWTNQPLPGVGSLAPFRPLTFLGVGLLGAIAAGWALLSRVRTSGGVGTWDCGYAAPTARIQYTSSSFADTLVGLFRWVLRPRVHRPHLEGIFPGGTRFASRVDDTVLDGLLAPAARAAEKAVGRVKVFQQGSSQRYILYVLVALVGLLLWSFPLERLFLKLFSR